MYSASALAVAVIVILLVFGGDRERDEPLFDFFERDACIPAPDGVNFNPRHRAVEELFGS